MILDSNSSSKRVSLLLIGILYILVVKFFIVLDNNYSGRLLYWALL